MKHFWAPWRMEYIRRKIERSDTGCFLCTVAEEEISAKNLVLKKNERAIILLNKYPYSNGHLLVAPRRHVEKPYELEEKEMTAIMELVSYGTAQLEKAFSPKGFNIGANIGRCAGAGEEHLHMHVLPRWIGDTNFMPIFTDTKVISEFVVETYDKLLPFFKG